MKDSLPKKLIYYGTETEVKPGDHIVYRPFLSLRARPGRVIYVPKKDGRKLASEGVEPDDWYIELESGVRYGWLYSPQDLQPHKRLRFVRRGEPGFEQTSSEQIEQEELEEETRGT